MKLYAESEAQALEFAQRTHDYLIANEPPYAASVAAGQTVRWAFPQQDEAGWFIPVESRCLGAFTEEELTRLEPPLQESGL